MKIGLTGGIGSGKSAVARLLSEHGALVVDADSIAREVVAAGTPGLAEIVQRFGPQVLTSDGELDRPKLGAIVFADAAARKDLEAITHPLIGARTAERMATAKRGQPVVHDIPLLVELQREGDYDLVVVVDAPVEVRLSRLEQHRGMPRDVAERRMASQASEQQRRAVADVWIDNSGDEAALAQCVDELWRTRICPES